MRSLQGRIGLILSAFVLLMMGSVGMTYWSVASQKQDAQVINLAGRQRMLLQQMGRLALEIGDEQEITPSAGLLKQSIETFDQTLKALKDGGVAPYDEQRTVVLPPAPTQEIRARLDQVQLQWEGHRARLETLLGGGEAPAQIADDLKELQADTPVLVGQMDEVVRLFEANSARKIQALDRIQIGSLAASLLLLMAGWWVVRRSVVLPIQELEVSAERIGRGELDVPIHQRGPLEVENLAASLENMRLQLHTSRQELVDWAATLEQRVHQRTLELEALGAISREITSHLEIQQVLRLVTEKTRALLGCDVASLCLLDEEGHTLNLSSTSGDEGVIQATTTEVQNEVLAAAQREEEGQAIRCDAALCSGFCAILKPRYRASHLAAPVRLGRRVIGALCVGSRFASVFSQHDGVLLSQLADTAAIAIENTRLYERAEHAAALEERQRIASEMHDGLLQTLSFIRMMTRLVMEKSEEQDLQGMSAYLDRMIKAENQAETEIRSAIESLHEDFPIQRTLQEQLEKMTAEMGESGFQVAWINRINLPLMLSRQESEEVLRVVREALTNAAKHSGAGRAQVILEREGERALVTVEDDGTGFEPGHPLQDGRMHFGLKIMEARALRLGGNLLVSSNPGGGTRVRLSWLPGRMGAPASALAPAGELGEG